MIDEKLSGIFVRLTKQQYQKLQDKGKQDVIPVACIVRLAVSKYFLRNGL